MRIGILGGTGKEGSGLAVRWARAGHEVAIGSRSAERAQARASELAAQFSVQLSDGGNAEVAAAASVVLLAVPYSAHRATLEGVREAMAGKILIDITVPLAPPKVRQVHLPAGQAAALEAQEILGDDVQVVAALHHISSTHLAPDSDESPHSKIDSDILVCGDDKAARETVISLIEDLRLGARGLDAGVLRNAIALEALTPVLLHMNRRYRSGGSGIRITGLPESAAPDRT